MTAAELGLDAIEARTNAATRGPWTTGVRWEDPCDIYWLPINAPSSNGEDPHQPDRVALIRYETCGFQYPHADARADAEFIAAARTDVPALVDEVKRLRAGLIVMTDQRDAARAIADELRDDLRAADESNANLQQHIAAIRAGEF